MIFGGIFSIEFAAISSDVALRFCSDHCYTGLNFLPSINTRAISSRPAPRPSGFRIATRATV